MIDLPDGNSGKANKSIQHKNKLIFEIKQFTK